MNSNLDCTIVILSYNSLDVTDTCLSKVETAIAYCEAKLHNKIKVIVVDNASKDGSAEMIKDKHPKVDLIALKENIGYPAGNNLGMKKSDTPFILLMNSDTYIEENSLVKIISELDKKKDWDIVVGKCVYANGVLQIYGGFLPTPLRIILWSFGFESIPVIKSFLQKIYGFNLNYYKYEGTMEWCPPNFLLLRREVYDKTKGFDEHLWFHWVDVEWSKRIHQNGFIIGFTPEIQVVHLGGASSEGLQAKLLHDNFKGLMYFFKKHYPKSVPTISGYLKTGLQIRSFFYSLFGKNELAKVYHDVSVEI